jgi:hypothetical protein
MVQHSNGAGWVARPILGRQQQSGKRISIASTMHQGMPIIYDISSTLASGAQGSAPGPRPPLVIVFVSPQIIHPHQACPAGFFLWHARSARGRASPARLKLQAQRLQAWRPPRSARGRLLRQ